MSDAASQRKMWGGRFERGPDASFYEFERSWKFDRRLLPQEFALDRAWARAIARAGILAEEEGEQLVTALDALETRAKSDAAWLDDSKAEDVHHFVETALIEKLGPLGAKLHTGSSLMPQKKNPDAWELIRGKTGRIYGSLIGLFTTMKGLPSSYQRDLQEDKENLFQAHDQALAMLQIAAATLATTQFREDRLRAAAQDPALVATEVADYLVTFGVPFREAHEVAGKVFQAAEKEGKSIREMPVARLREFSPVFDGNLVTALTLESALARRSLPGGTAPGAVRAALQEFKARLAKLETES
jgi:argininosuccinate lyase